LVGLVLQKIPSKKQNLTLGGLKDRNLLEQALLVSVGVVFYSILPCTVIRFIYFDLDDTLLDHHYAQEQALAASFAAFDWGMATLTELQTVYHHINVQLWTDYAQGNVTKDELNTRRFSETIATLEAKVAMEAFKSHYLHTYAHHWQYISGAEATFRTVASRVPVGILTNGFVEIQSDKLARFPELRRLSAAVVISEEVGVLKPHPELFRWATQKAGVTPEEILCVGDSLASDVLGSLRAGWQAAWFRRSSQLVEAPKDAFVFSVWQDLIQFVEAQNRCQSSPKPVVSQHHFIP